MITVVGPHLPSPRVRLSTGGSQAIKVLLLAGSASLAIAGLATNLPIVLVPAAGLLVAAWGAFPLSEVETDGLFLYVSQLRSSARIPLSDVSAVRVGWWPRSSFRVVVEFRSQTPVGKRIVYEPPMDWMGTMFDHRAVRELRALIAQARTAEVKGGSLRS